MTNSYLYPQPFSSPSSSSSSSTVYSPHGVTSINLEKAISKRKAEKSRLPTFLDKLISIRVVLVAITITTVICLAMGLILLSTQAQHDIVSTLSGVIQERVSDEITSQVGNLFKWAETELQIARLVFELKQNATQVGNGTNPFLVYTYIAEYMWSIARKHPVGVYVEFDFTDGRLFGMESINSDADMYWADYVNGSLYTVAWDLQLNQSVYSVNKSSANYLYEYEMGNELPSYAWLRDPNRTYLRTCDEGSVWFDLILLVIPDATYSLISDYITICDRHGELFGYLTVTLSISSIVDVVTYTTTHTVDGKIFIMDSKQQLVASSTNSEVFSLLEDGTYRRNTIATTNERWIFQVGELIGEENDFQRKLVSINGTQYFLSVNHWNEFEGIDWYIVELLTTDQFLGNSHAYYVKSIVAATSVSVAAIIVVLIVTWAATKPLFILAADLQRMSQLDLEISDMTTPRLLEVGKLYRSVASMYVALQSFKKFVPVQIISKIIKSEKEASAELVNAKISIIFQDIEGFTSLSESLDPMVLAALTSEYMKTMTNIICNHGGTIDKYIGDCIMSLFNAPEELPNYPVAATAAATECIQALLEKNKEWKLSYGCEMHCRIGINTGEVLIGNMGSEHRMNYTAFGDNVNVAARLEGVNKYFGTRIIVSKSTYIAFPWGKFLTRKLAKVRVSGKCKPTSIYEVSGEKTLNNAQIFKLYESSLNYFKAKEFLPALHQIEEALAINANDIPSIKLKKRIQSTMDSLPIPTNWTYIEDLCKF